MRDMNIPRAGRKLDVKLNKKALLKSLELSLAHLSRTNNVKSRLEHSPLLQYSRSQMVKGSIESRWHDDLKQHVPATQSHSLACTSAMSNTCQAGPGRPAKANQIQAVVQIVIISFHDSEKLGKSVKTKPPLSGSSKTIPLIFIRKTSK